MKLRVTGDLSKVPCWKEEPKPVRDDKNERGRKWRTSEQAAEERAKEKEKKGGTGLDPKQR